METFSTTIAPVSDKNLVEVARELGPVISTSIDEEEQARRLSRPVLDALKGAGFFRLLLPRSLGVSVT